VVVESVVGLREVVSYKDGQGHGHGLSLSLATIYIFLINKIDGRMLSNSALHCTGSAAHADAGLNLITFTS